MKKISFWSLVLIGLTMIIGCGGDGSDSTQSSIVDGVNVSNVRKLVSLTYNYDGGYNDYKIIDNYQAKYDSKGRLEKVSFTEKLYQKENLSNEITVDALKIDYDLRVLAMWTGFSYNYSTKQSEPTMSRLPFSFNSQGYISQIGGYSLNYDSYRYFTGLDSSKDIWNIVYKDNDLSKSLASFNSKLSTYYFTYGNNSKQGDLYFYINSELPSNSDYYLTMRTICCYIAYQAGLFGKITQNGIYASSEKERSAIIERINEKNSKSELYKFSLVFE